MKRTDRRARTNQWHFRVIATAIALMSTVLIPPARAAKTPFAKPSRSHVGPRTARTPVGRPPRPLTNAQTRGAATSLAKRIRHCTESEGSEFRLCLMGIPLSRRDEGDTSLSPVPSDALSAPKDQNSPSGAEDPNPTGCTIPMLDDKCETWASASENPNGASGSSAGYDLPIAEVVAPGSGMVIVTGTSYDASTQSNDFSTIAYDPNSGDELWAARFGGQSSNDVPLAIASSPDGESVYVTGQENFGMTTVAYDMATGSEKWNSRYAAPGGFGGSVNVSPDGRTVYAVGNVPGSNGGSDYITVAYDASTGASLWESGFESEDHARDIATASAISPDGTRMYVTGSSGFYASSGGTDYLTVAYDAMDGSQLWIARENLDVLADGYDFDVPVDIAVAGNNARIHVTGMSEVFSADYATVTYTDTGRRLWVQRYSGSIAPPEDARGILADDDRPAGITVSPDGRFVYVTGTSKAATQLIPDGWVATVRDTDIATVAYSATTGEQL